MRKLSERQIRTCENATTKRCRCRCGGTLHGVAHLDRPVQLAMLDAHHGVAMTDHLAPAC